MRVTIHTPSLLYSEEQTNTRIIAAFKDPLQLTECSIEGLGMTKVSTKMLYFLTNIRGAVEQYIQGFP